MQPLLLSTSTEAYLMQFLAIGVVKIWSNNYIAHWENIKIENESQLVGAELARQTDPQACKRPTKGKRGFSMRRCGDAARSLRQASDVC